MTIAPVRDPLAYQQPSPLAGVHSMELLAIAEKWRPYRSLATTYGSPPPSSGRGTTGGRA